MCPPITLINPNKTAKTWSQNYSSKH